MFAKEEMDDRGEVPAPFNIDKFNFNPHAVRGDFDFDRNKKPIIKKNKQGQYTDKRGNLVTGRGYRIDHKRANCMIDNFGRKKFDKA